MLSKSNGTGLFGGRAGGQITVIDSRFYRSSARNAKVAFYLTIIIVGLLAAVIASDRMHPILGLFYGALIAVPTGAIVWAVVRIWPLLRLIWWWLPEIVLAGGAIYAWTALADATGTALMAVVVALAVGVPTVVGPIRRRIVAVAWCLIVRHRLRTCFAQFLTNNRSGSLPLIGIARLTPVGERVVIRLRPGLSMTDLESRLDKLAVGCRASTVTVERASTGDASRVVVNTKRRQVLDQQVASPLVDLVHTDTDDDTDTDPVTPHLAVVPTALDLPDVTTAPVASNGNGHIGGKANGRKTNGTASSSSAVITPNGTSDDDVSQWI